jgi:uncharacterized damage-inducible protein DinB
MTHFIEDSTMRKLLTAFAVAGLLAAPVAAQDHAGESHTDPATAVQAVQDQFMGWIVAAAEQVSEADYAFKPVATVRSMGELFGHVANANFMICAGMRGQNSPATMDYEKASRAEVIAGLKASSTYCAEVAKWGAEHHHDAVTLFGSMKGDVTWALAFNASHNAEHYGNIVTYMRMKGMVPPSSQPGM